IFFFQAEDGIRDLTVTGVQTCALPIFIATWLLLVGQRLSNVADRGGHAHMAADDLHNVVVPDHDGSSATIVVQQRQRTDLISGRSEERRVGKERRSRCCVSMVTINNYG